MTLTDKNKAAIKRIWDKVDATHEAEAFWQDHFYSSGGKFGYPVCVQLINTATKQVEDSAVIGWHTWKSGGEVMLEKIEAYLIEIGAVKSHSAPDENASAAAAGYADSLDASETLESGVSE